MWALPEDRQTASVIVVRVQIPIVEVELVTEIRIVDVAVERIRGGLPLFLRFPFRKF